MNREELLNNLGLSSDELQDLVFRFGNFQRELNPAQRRVLVRFLPSLEQAGKTLGPTPKNLEELFHGESDRVSDAVLCLFAGDECGDESERERKDPTA